MKETKRQLGNSFSAMSGSLEDADPESSEMNLETAVGAVGDNSAFGPASRLPAPTTFLWLWPTRHGVRKQLVLCPLNYPRPRTWQRRLQRGTISGGSMATHAPRFRPRGASRPSLRAV